MSTERSDGASSGPEWRRSRNAGPEEAPQHASNEEGHDVEETTPQNVPKVRGRRRGKRLVAKDEAPSPKSLTADQRLLILDAWQRSGLPAKDFAPLVGVSKHTLYNWKKRFDNQGPAGLETGQRGGARGSRLPEVTKRAILLLKKSNPEWGCRRISDVLYRGKGFPASPKAVARVLKAAGYELEDTPTTPHRDKVRRFERAAPGNLWQTDLFTFVLKRQNRRVHLVAYLDDHSRYVVSFGLSVSASTDMVLESLRAGITAYGLPQEVLTDNGPQYVTWRGKSRFTKECEALGIQQIVARPRHPQTLGKTERFWGTLWRELLSTVVFVDLGDAEARISHFIDHYNFQRPHQGIGGMVPADRFFKVESEVRASIEKRVKENAEQLARDGEPKKPFYLTGNVGDQAFSVHAEGERVFLVNEDGAREEVELTSKTARVPDEPISPDEEAHAPHRECTTEERALDANIQSREPGSSPLDDFSFGIDPAMEPSSPEVRASDPSGKHEPERDEEARDDDA